MNTDYQPDTDYDRIEERNDDDVNLRWDWHILYIGQYRSAEFQSVEAGKHRITLMFNDGGIHDTGYINQSEKAEGILRNWVLYGEQNSHLYKIDDLIYWTKEVVE